MRLKVRDAPWNLIATRRIHVYSSAAGLKGGDLVKLENRDHRMAVVVDEVERANENAVSLDKNMRENLVVNIGDAVDVDKLGTVDDARHVEVAVYGDVDADAGQIKGSITGAILHVDNTEYLSKAGIDYRITVSRTEPGGFVRITPATELVIRGVYRDAMKKSSTLAVIQSPGNDSFHVTVEAPTITFNDIGGLSHVKELLRENVVLAIEKADVYKKVGYKPIKGIMLYGPTGTGKTVIARSLAGEARANFIFVPGSKIKNMWWGQSERILREVFESAKKAAPCIIFIDEIDSIGYSRTDLEPTGMKISVVSQLLLLMDQIRDDNVFVISATNMPEVIDPALKRPGRFIPVEVPMPDRDARKEILKVHLRPSVFPEWDLEELTAMTDGYSGAQIEAVCNQARMEAMKETDFSWDTRLEARHVRMVLAKGVIKHERENIYL